jgi:RNA polymerase sigma-70 factor (family 1)
MNDSAHFSDWQHRIAVADDEDAFLHLYRYFKQRLEKFAYSICHSREDAEDIVEDVFVRIWTKRRTLDQVHNLKLYLYVATRNFSLNYCRVRQRNAHLDIEDLKIEFLDISIDPQQQMVDAEQVRLLNETVQHLPNKCKIIFKLVKEDGLKQKEVAELLHLTPKTIENQLAIAIKRLALALGRKPRSVPKTSLKNPEA